MANYTRQVTIPGKSAEELFTTMSTELEPMLKRAQMGSFVMDQDASAKELKIKGSLFSATLTCKDARMDLDVKLSMLATPFRSKIDETITKFISKTFPTAV